MMVVAILQIVQAYRPECSSLVTRSRQGEQAVGNPVDRFQLVTGTPVAIGSRFKFPQEELGMARFDLTDREWAVIAPLLPNKPRGVGRTEDGAA